jgi:hypothetical protein
MIGFEPMGHDSVMERIIKMCCILKNYLSKVYLKFAANIRSLFSCVISWHIVGFELQVLKTFGNST